VTVAVLTADTATKLPPNAAGHVVVCGSHGGRYPGALAAKAGLRAILLSDAGIGRDEAGVGGLALLDGLGIAAAALGHDTCRIGDPRDMLARGRVSRANGPAAALGVVAGMPCREAADRLKAAPHVLAAAVPAASEGRSAIEGRARRLVLVDSAAMVEPGDAGHVIVTGSHGGLVGGDPALALRVAGAAAAFNDAGVGFGDAGITRLPALDARGIPAVTVAALSARIGEARSTLEDGIVSRVNAAAARRGARVGIAARDLLRAWADGSI
jgi:hypothetical protein